MKMFDPSRAISPPSPSPSALDAVFRGKEANSGFQGTIKNYEKIIALVHHAHLWSFTVTGTMERKLQMYGSMVKVGYKQANMKLKVV